MVQATTSPTSAGSDGKQLLAPVAEALGREWRCLADVIVRAWGEEGRVDLVALHRSNGVALVGLVEEGEEASPEGAVEAFRAMLRDGGFEDRFPGRLTIVALTAPPSERKRLGDDIAAAVADAPVSTVAAGWLEWVVRLLEPPAEAAPAAVDQPTAQALQPAAEVAAAAAPAIDLEAPPWPRLVAPRRDDVPTRPTAGGILATAAREAPVRSAAPGEGWIGWAPRLGFALAVVAVLLTAMAVFSHGATPL